MTRKTTGIKTTIGIAGVFFAGLLMAGCAATSAPAPTISVCRAKRRRHHRQAVFLGRTMGC
jgi:hypothetical protein